MKEKLKKYLILVCAMGGIVLHGIGWSETREARALPPISGTESVRVQVISSENTITLDYSVPVATLTSLDEESPCPKGTCTKTRVKAGNANQRRREGEPVIPVIPSIIIIPAGKAIDNITVIRSGEFEHEGEYFLEFGGKARVISDNTPFEPATPDDSIYYSDNPFPGITHELVTVQNKCGVSIAYINLYPITYYPLSGRVVSYCSTSINVNLKEASAQSVYDIACRPERVHPERMGIENLDALGTYTPEYCQQVRDGLPTGGICDPAETYEYVVITTEALKNATPQYPLSYLINHRVINSGLTATVVTTDGTDGIYNNYIGSEVPDDPIDKIRSFISNAYNNWDSKYVLIIGDPNMNTNAIVPMRLLWGIDPRFGTVSNVYSDLYYQCLNGNYNPDGDSYWGEDAFDGDGDVDLVAEVYIGRAYVENPIELSNFIDKTIKYEESVLANDSYLDKVSILGEWLISFPTSELYAKPFMERIRLGADNPKTFGFICCPYYTDIDVLYEENGAWSKNDVIQNINEIHYGIINHLGHCSENYLIKLVVPPGVGLGDIASLENDKFPFLYSQGCLAGNPGENSIGEKITTSTEHGVWGAVLNTHYGVGSVLPYSDQWSQCLNKEFWHGYFYEGIFNVGALLAYSHEKNTPDVGDRTMRWVYYCNNLFGDPYTQFKDPIPCERNIAHWTFLGKEDVLARKLITTGEDVFIPSVPETEITFMSGKEIRMGPGLHIYNGAEFKAFIDPILYKSDCD